MINLSPTLTFDEKKHQYYLDNVQIPSVSRIMLPLHGKLYGAINPIVLNKAADRGTRVHRAIEFRSKYGFNKYDDDIRGYIEAYEKFRKEHVSWELLHSELRLYHKGLLYGMTIDEVYNTENGIVICDLKTTSSEHLGPWSVQLSAYKAGFESYFPDKQVSETYVIHIGKDGNYSLLKLKDTFDVFLACLRIYRFEV